MDIGQFRETRACELEVLNRTLESVFATDVNTTPVSLAIEQLRRETPQQKDGTRNANHWGYVIEDFKMPVDTVKHLKPKSINNSKVELILSMRLIADFKAWETFQDPLVDLSFKVVIRGVGDSGPHFFCFHIDKHDLTKFAEEPHPVYHLQYASNPLDDDLFDYGSTFHLDTPRIMHYPLDLILGIGFLTSNFYPMAFNLIMEDGYFSALYKRYQGHIIRPYFHTLASHWDYDISKIIWGKNALSPALL